MWIGPIETTYYVVGFRNNGYGHNGNTNFELNRDVMRTSENKLD